MKLEQKEKYLKAIEAVRPEAKEFVDAILNEHLQTTKDNYGKVMAFLSDLKPVLAQIFLLAMEREGYPHETANQAPSNHGVEAMIEIQRHGKFWAVFMNQELVCLCVYRKGATSLKELLTTLLK